MTAGFLRSSVSQGLLQLGPVVEVCTLWHQRVIRVKESVEQRAAQHSASRVTPVANESLADLGLCGSVDWCSVVKGNFLTRVDCHAALMSQMQCWAERDLQEKYSLRFIGVFPIFGTLS